MSSLLCPGTPDRPHRVHTYRRSRRPFPRHRVARWCRSGSDNGPASIRRARRSRCPRRTPSALDCRRPLLVPMACRGRPRWPAQCAATWRRGHHHCNPAGARTPGSSPAVPTNPSSEVASYTANLGVTPPRAFGQVGVCREVSDANRSHFDSLRGPAGTGASPSL